MEPRPEETSEEALAAQRARMVEEQIAARGVKDARVLAAMRSVPRHLFLSDTDAPRAYEDHPVNISCGQTISQPYMVAHMTEALQLKPSDRVLEIGTGSGYQAAVLSELAMQVYSIERHPQLAEESQEKLQRLGYTNVRVICADGTQGFSDAAPYEAILVTAGGPNVPEPLTRQLTMGGRLICPAGDRKLQRLMRLTRTGEGLHYETGLECVFVPLVGESGWPEGTE